MKVRCATIADALSVSDALADALCWFQGFRAANPEAALPGSLDTLRDLNIVLKDHAYRQRDIALAQIANAEGVLREQGKGTEDEPRDLIRVAYSTLAGKQLP